MQTYFKIFFVFFHLGCISFGGPAAHLVFFHQTFVVKRKWLTEHEYAQLVAMAQVIPGPSSSQVGLAIGYVLRGYWGAVYAWLGFTLPSAVLMGLIAVLGIRLSPYLNSDFYHVMQVTVLAIVTWAFWQMLRSFCRQLWQYILMFASGLFIYFTQFSLSQMLVIIIAAGVGVLMARRVKTESRMSKKQTQVFNLKAQRYANKWLFLFLFPFLLFPLIQQLYPGILLQSLEGFYRASSLVFGGGHVILPLLHRDFVVTGLISNEHFDLGYAFAQLMPGPLFSFASYLGALSPFTNVVWMNALIGIVAIYIPSFFLVFGALPYWSWLVNQPKVFEAIAGINAAVVGILLSLMMQMLHYSIWQWTDIVFVAMVVLLLRSKVPGWLSLVGSSAAYYWLLQL